MQDKLNIAVFVDYDNIEIGVKSTLQREFDVSVALNALKERGDIVAKFAYANWARQEGATKQMAANAVQMVQRIPSPRGDKNGADINLALDALEMAFTHDHVNAFAIVSGDSDFIPLVNKLREFGKTIYVLGGKAFTSTILQQNCHEFISYESLLDEPQRGQRQQHSQQSSQQSSQRLPRRKAAPLDISLAMPLLERALHVLERRGVQPQLGLLKSTMLQLDAAFSEKAYGCSSFSDFVEKLKHAGFVSLSGSEGRYFIERKATAEAPQAAALKPDEALPLLRDLLETHRLEMESGVLAEQFEAWVQEAQPDFKIASYGLQEFAELLNFAQDKLLVRIQPDEEKGLLVYLGAEFYPPAPLEPEPTPEAGPQEEEEDEPQPIVEGQPSAFAEPEPPPKPRRTRSRKADGQAQPAKRKPRARRTTPRLHLPMQ
ncbi:MAG: NYN domain-containing protein [Bryobacterales bacterium]|nr:NYN domain-containing protein [Bryobacterales bacterium]